MRISCISVCVDYVDYLAHTLPCNRHHFDHYIIITSKEDKETPKIAEEYGADVVKTNAFYENGNKFNKGRAINDGVDRLDHPEWILFLDTDMVLYNGFRRDLKNLVLDTEYLYGSSRFICPNYNEWSSYFDEPTGMQRGPERSNYINGLPRGQWRDGKGWKKQNHKNKGNKGECGYFQLFHATASSLGKKPWYPTKTEHAGGSDRLFYKKFSPNVTKLEIPSPIELHSDYWGTAVNNWKDPGPDWCGRKTPKFGK